MGFLRDISTENNVGSEDIIHRAMKWQIGLLPGVLFWGLIMETLFAFGIVKTFDLQSVFAAVLFYEGGVTTLLAGGTLSLFFRKTANPDGSASEVEALNKGKQPDINVNTTVIQP